MLVQNIRTAKELGITELQHKSLCLTLSYLETGKVKYFDYDEEMTSDLPSEKYNFSGLFNMSVWKANTDCGTVGCIAGTAEMLGGCRFNMLNGVDKPDLELLFYPHHISHRYWDEITVEYAARALRNYLTYGHPKWDEIVPKEWLVSKSYLTYRRFLESTVD